LAVDVVQILLGVRVGIRLFEAGRRGKFTARADHVGSVIAGTDGKRRVPAELNAPEVIVVAVVILVDVHADGIGGE
jgi:hypothetical protein